MFYASCLMPGIPVGLVTFGSYSAFLPESNSNDFHFVACQASNLVWKEKQVMVRPEG